LLACQSITPGLTGGVCSAFAPTKVSTFPSNLSLDIGQEFLFIMSREAFIFSKARRFFHAFRELVTASHDVQKTESNGAGTLPSTTLHEVRRDCSIENPCPVQPHHKRNSRGASNTTSSSLSVLLMLSLIRSLRVIRWFCAKHEYFFELATPTRCRIEPKATTQLYLPLTSISTALLSAV